jgi:predicted dehydrogenase
MTMKPTRPLRLAMVGGGPGSFIGPVHRMAAELDRALVLVAGAFSSRPERSIEAGRAWGLAAERCYPDYRALLDGEGGRPDGAEAIAIVTPNHLHAPVAIAALQSGYHVISDKPATATLDEARQVERAVRESGRLYGLTFTYTGYPMVRQAREMIRSGALGAVRKATVEYSQGWLSETLERTGNKQAAWRVDPTQAGAGGCIGDIGVHAFNILEFVSGRQVVEFCAHLSAVGEGRVLDDDCNVLLRLDNGAPGVLVASQIAAGDRNGLRLRVSGERGTLVWSHEDPTVLTVNWADAPVQVFHAGAPYLGAASLRATRLPTGHPEGFIEAFANIYRDFADAALGAGEDLLVPSIEAGIRSQAFVETAVEASRRRAGWVALETGRSQ